jgi:hypothetical protein
MFKPAVKEESKAKVVLLGPPGSGKTYTALRLATGMGVPIAVIDTEHGSASKYADEFKFDVQELVSFSPRTYIDTINEAVKAGYGTLIIDSLSHAWAGKGGALEMVDTIGSQKRGGSFSAWADVTPIQNQLMDLILAAPIHVFATLRTKIEYAIEQVDRNGKARTEVIKLGLKPIQRDDVEYLFDVVLQLDVVNNAVVTKSRCKALRDQRYYQPGEEISQALLEWLSGAPPRDRERDTIVDALNSLIETLKTQGTEVSLDQGWLDTADKDALRARGKELKALLKS